MPEPTPATTVEKVGLTEWVKIITGIGFAGVVGWACLKYVLGEGKSNAEFQRTVIQQNTTALSASTEQGEDVQEALDDFAISVAPLTHQLDRVADAVRAKIKADEEVQAEAESP